MAEEPPFEMMLVKSEHEEQSPQTAAEFLQFTIRDIDPKPQTSEERIISVIREENQALRAEIETLNGRITWLTETVVEMKEIMYKRTQNPDFEPNDFNFPLRTEFDLSFIDKEIGESHSFKSECILEMRNLFSHKSLSKTLTNVMAVELILEFNIDGVHNKKGLRNYGFFFSALIDAVQLIDKSQPPIKALQKAMHCVKNNACKRRSRADQELKSKKEEKNSDD